MMKFKYFIPIYIIIFFVGCSDAPRQEKTIPNTPSHQKLKDLLKDEYNLDVITKAFANTLWVYLPLDNPFLNIVSSKNGPLKSEHPQEKFQINFLDGKFSDQTFHIRYNITKEETYADDKSITTQFSEEYSAKQRFLLNAIGRAYSEVEKKPDSNRYVERIAGDIDFLGHKKNLTHKKLVHSYVKTDDVPDFIVIAIADIVKGIEIRMYLYLQDLRRASHDQGFGEEYIKRLIVDQPIGHEIIIGDKTGEHLDAHDLTWPEFLTKQMIYRTTFKYTISSLPPLPDPKEQLIQIAAQTIQGYHFQDFESVNLIDLNKNTTKTLSKNEIKTIEITPPSPPGKTHRIKFQIDAPEEDFLVK